MYASSLSRPMSVEQIARVAQDFEYSDFIPLHHWLRTADALLTEASIYAREGNEQQTYLLLLRHAQLVLGCLSRHPDARDPRYRARLAEAKHIVNENLATLEALKPSIQKRYERYRAVLRAQAERRVELENARSYRDGTSLAGDLGRLSLDFQQGDETDEVGTYGRRRALVAGENRDLAVRLAHMEMDRRAAARSQSGGGTRRIQTKPMVKRLHEADEDDRTEDFNLEDVSRQIIATGQKMSRDMYKNGTLSTDGKTFSPAPYHYPDIPSKSAYEIWGETHMQPIQPSASREPPTKGILKPPRAPILPTKEFNQDDVPRHSIARSRSPPLPPEKLRQSPTPQDLILRDRASSASPQPSLNPPDYTFQPSSYLENGTTLRSIFLPTSLRPSFLAHSASNTRNNLETCGILVGTIISNALFISKVLIPEQHSTTDTCEVTDDLPYFEYCEKEELLVFGWIHTHPSQTCFMSSRDLHTQFPYQVQLAESVAIVCAPRSEPSWGVFRLTDPPGMKVIKNCTKPGIFHLHDVDNIYTDALRPGHVFEAPGLNCEVVDLRPGHT